MIQVQLIISVIELERRLQFEKENKSNMPYEFYMNVISALIVGKKSRKSQKKDSESHYLGSYSLDKSDS